MNPKLKLLDDFIEFSRIQMGLYDVDPSYPVLKYLQQDLDPESAVWHTILFVAFYNLPSAHTAFLLQPTLGLLPDSAGALPIHTQRRGFRGGIRPINRHLASWEAWAEHYGGLLPFLNAPIKPEMTAEQKWVESNFWLRSVWGNSVWASYKTAEILLKVNGFDFVPTSIGHPPTIEVREGLALFYPPLLGTSALATETANTQARGLIAYLGGQGVSPTPDLAEIETLLCDFYHMAHSGSYYPGHDIDEMQSDLIKAAEIGVIPGHVIQEIYDARRALWPSRWLGEHNNYPGIDKPRKHVYMDSGVLAPRYPAEFATRKL